MSSAPKQRRVLLRDQPVDIFVAGYLLTKDMVKHLCLLAYGATQADIDHFGALDFAALYYSERDVIESPSLIPVTYYNHSNTIEDGWLLPGRAAFHNPRVSPPKLEYDKATKAYLDQWLPPHLLKRDEFKGIRYVQTPWPRGVVRACHPFIIAFTPGY